MSLFKSLLFTEDTPRRAFGPDNEGEAFGPTYGNQIANEKQFREPWDANGQPAPSQPTDAAQECCTE